MTFAAEEPGQILSQDAQGRVLVSRDAAGAVRPQRDERSKVRPVLGDQIFDAGPLAPKPASSSTTGRGSTRFD